MRLRERSQDGWQREQLARTGFVANAEIGHQVIAALLGRGYPHTVATVGGHLAAVGTRYNWQGCARIAQLMRRSKRTVQRARARLERDRLIASRLLLTGDRLEGQRAAVWHPQVVRDVERLQRIARMRSNPDRLRPRRRKPSAAEVPAPAPEASERISPAEVVAYHAQLAAEAARRAQQPPPEAAPPIEPTEIDEWDRETAERERAQPPATERGPPE